MIATPGYHDISLAEYLADPCEKPSLSTEVVHTLFYETPKHAQLRHPRLKGERSDSTPRADIGSAVHELTRGHDDVVVYAPPDFEDWKKKAAQEFRDAAREVGKVPLLARQQLQVECAAGNARNAIAQLGAGAFERTLIWQVDGVWRRGRADWLSDGPVQLEKDYFAGGVDVDLKTVESAERLAWLRTNVLPTAQKLDIQMGLRDEGHQVLTGRQRGMLWLLQELEAPYEASWLIVTQAMLTQAQLKITHASKIWHTCIESNTWPGYGMSAMRAEPGAWAEMDIMSRIGAA